VLTSRGGTDAFVAKYAADNTLLWARRMGGDNPDWTGSTFDVGTRIAIDGSGNVYVTGRFSQTADFGSFTRTSAGGKDGFVAKLNASGTVQWANRWGTADAEEGYGIGVDAAGNVYAVGSRVGSTATTTGSDVLRFSPTGATSWSRWVNTRYFFLGGGDLAVSAAGNVFVTSSFFGTVDFDPGVKTKYVSSGTHMGQTDYGTYVLKLTSAGNFGWVSAFAGQAGSSGGHSSGQSIALDGGGNVIVGGIYDGQVDFNPGSGTTTLPTTGRAFLSKLNSGGGLVWARALESDNTSFVYGLAVDAAGSIYATGTLNGTVDFDAGSGTQTRTTTGESDLYVLKLDAAGNFNWVETFGGTGSEVGFGVAVDPAGIVHLAGSYRSASVDFDPDPLTTYELVNPGTFGNFFLVRLLQS
jgi:hypothetical protein